MLELEIIKNPKTAPNSGKMYGQDVEPKGTYVIKNQGFVPEGWLEGTAMLNNPLFIDVDSDNLVKWKYELAEEMKAKGKKLTEKLMNKGYDAIITKYSGNDYGEIILFPNANFILNKKEMKENKINSLLETYESISEDDLKEITYSPSEGKDEAENKYWIDQAVLTLQREKNKNPSLVIGKSYQLNLDFPNQIFNLYGDTFILVLFSKEAEYSEEKIKDIVFLVRFEKFKDGIKIRNTRSTPDVRGGGLAQKVYNELKSLYGAIYSDTTQSPSSRFAIWGKLYDNNPSQIKAFKTETSEYFDVVKPDKELLYDDNGELKKVYTKKDNGILLVYI